MNVSNFRWERQIALCLVVLLLAPVSALAATATQTASTVGATPSAEASPMAATGQTTTSPAAPTATSPTAPSTPAPSPQPARPDAPAQAANQDQQTGSAQNPQPQQQNPAPATLGTAAAPYETQSGVSGSKPAGAAIAPGKQRRTHSFAIRVALLVGAAVAIGVVTAASLSSPSRPN